MSNQTSTHIPSDFLNTNAAEQYENAENATRHFAKIIVQSSSIGESIRSGEQVHVLDCACGPGAVVQEVYDPVAREKWGQLKVTGTDFSPGMLDYLGKRGERRGWTGLDTKTVDGKVSFFQIIRRCRCPEIIGLFFLLTMGPGSRKISTNPFEHLHTHIFF